MSISLYAGIAKQELSAARTTSEGKTYTLNHSDKLVVNMRYKGETGSNVNSQGWERSSSYFFKEIQNQHPEYFSKKNNILIESGKSPVVDTKFVNYFPQYKEYKGETLVHHHIGQDGQAVALPQSVHKGYGEIHTVEHELGITDKAEKFSKSCGEACKKDPSLYGRTSDQFKSINCDKSQVTNAFKKATTEKLSICKENAIQSIAHKSQGSINKRTSTLANEKATRSH